MISVHVKFHLNAGSSDYFLTWLDAIGQEIRKQEGFLDTGGELQNNGTIGYLFLQFDSESHLDKWVATEVHDHWFGELKAHRGQFEVAKVNTDDPDYDPDADLAWRLID